MKKLQKIMQVLCEVAMILFVRGWVSFSWVVEYKLYPIVHRKVCCLSDKNVVILNGCCAANLQKQVSNEMFIDWVKHYISFYG